MSAAGVMAGLEGAKSLSSFIVALNQARQLKKMKKELLSIDLLIMV